MLEKLESLAAGKCGLTYAQFIATALYDPQFGYYSRTRARVGKSADTDFYTSTSLGPLFGKLVAEACTNLLTPHCPKDFVFLEIGAEPGTSVLEDVAHPFAAARTLRLGEDLVVEGPVVLFANEWLDAQPFHRLILQKGRWRELGVKVKEKRLEQVQLETLSPTVLPYLEHLPTSLGDGYHFDLPTGASEALRQLLSQCWSGLFLTLDYGKPLAELLTTCPQGTARAYHQHAQSNDLLARPGEQDLTCHLCWDWLEALLQENGCTPTGLLRQESLFVRHAPQTLQTVMESPDNPGEKGRLKELLHPAHLGLKFQALHGFRLP